tara:strand:- start:578 stop:1075 length:498 start_codon:yes stop_codon:yes gene_type:complete
MNLIYSLLFVFALIQTEWKKESSTIGNFSFEMPGKPIKKTTDANGLNLLEYSLHGDIIYGVTYFNYEDAGATMKKEFWESAYENMKKGTLDACDCQLLNENDKTSVDIFIRDFSYSLIHEGNYYIYFKKVIFHKNKVFSLTIGALMNKAPILKKNKELFFNSLSY